LRGRNRSFIDLSDQEEEEEEKKKKKKNYEITHTYILSMYPYVMATIGCGIRRNIQINAATTKQKHRNKMTKPKTYLFQDIVNITQKSLT